MFSTSVKFIYKDGKLTYLNPEDLTKYDLFTKGLKEGDVVESYFTQIVDNSHATAGQLAKIHAMLNELAKHTGYTLDEMKDIIKVKAGFVDPASFDVKSFKDASKEEMSNIIQECIILGQSMNVYL
jgi:hypothetical protein